MAALEEQEFVSVADEKFDFDISLSPASSKGDNEDDDEVFFGPMRHKEKCIAYGVEARAQDGANSGPSAGENPSWTPLADGNFEEIAKEAQQVVSHLDGSLHRTPKPKSSAPEEVFTPAAKTLDVVCPARQQLSPIKRETFCIQDSPMKLLPAAIQQRLSRASGTSAAATAAGPTRPRLSTSSPIRQPAPQPKMALRSKTGLAGPRGVLPSKPSLPASTHTPAKTRPAPPVKNKLQPPTRGTLGMRRSLSSRTSIRMGSTEELMSDSASITSDVSDTSLNSSITIGKGSVPPPSKPVLRRASVVVKAPVVQTQRGPAGRRNTSSSSSSVSSINSSISASPMPKAKLNSSLNSSSVGTAAVPAATKTRRPSAVTRAPEPPAARKATASTQTRKPSEALAKSVRSTPSTPRQTPARRSVAPTSAAQSARADSAVRGNANARLTGLATATPSNPAKGVGQLAAWTPDGSRIMKPKRLLSAVSMESLIQKPGPVTGLQTPSAGRDGSLPASKMRRLSALPTTNTTTTTTNTRGRHASSSTSIQTPKSSAKPLLSRRTESIPAPSRKSCFKSPPRAEDIQPSKPQAVPEGKTPRCTKKEPSSGVQKPEPCSPVLSLKAELETAPPGGVVELDDPEVVKKLEPQLQAVDPTLVNIEPQPALKKEEEEEKAPEETKALVSIEPQPALKKEEEKEKAPGQTKVSQPAMKEEKKRATEQTPLPDAKSQKKTEVLLMDLPAPELTNEKPLIDLSNTPDLVRTASVKSTEEELIDLSSPLIKWSPADKKENAVKEARLIDLSF